MADAEKTVMYGAAAAYLCDQQVVESDAEAIRSWELRVYAKMQQTKAFWSLAELYDKVRGVLGSALYGPVRSLDKPDIYVERNKDESGIIAEWVKDGGSGGHIKLCKSAYETFVKMLEYEANWNKEVAEETHYYLDQVIGHELGHALLHTAYFDHVRYEYAGEDRRKDDGLAELIGMYLAQRVRGRPTDNATLSEVMLEWVGESSENTAVFVRELEGAWGSLSEHERREELKELDTRAKRSLYYDYPMLGIAEALRANPDMRIEEFIGKVLTKPGSMAGVMDHVVAVSRAAAELQTLVKNRAEREKMFVRHLAGSRMFQYLNRVDEAEATRELELQEKLSAEIVDGVSRLTA